MLQSLKKQKKKIHAVGLTVWNIYKYKHKNGLLAYTSQSLRWQIVEIDCKWNGECYLFLLLD